MTLTVYGLKTCDTCRKARRWLDDAGIAHHFVDVRETPPDAASLGQWVARLGAAALVNRRSTTWRGLGEDARQRGLDDSTAPGLLAEQPTLIKRPVFVHGDWIACGFDGGVRAALAKPGAAGA